MTITWLHGLFGAPTDLASVARRLEDQRQHVPLALPGHGDAPALASRSAGGFDEATGALWATLDGHGVQTTALVGYSMGARLAMHLALQHPERVTHLVCIGGHPGIAEDGERSERLALDRERAASLRTLGMRAFLTQWYAQPLFADFRASPGFADTVAARCDGDVTAIATTLERLSTGHQQPLFEAMAACVIPTLWVAGERDPRYEALLGPLAEAQPTGRFVSVAGAGHAVHLEAPEALAGTLDAFLNESSARGSASQSPAGARSPSRGR